MNWIHRAEKEYPKNGRWFHVWHNHKEQTMTGRLLYSKEILEFVFWEHAAENAHRYVFGDDWHIVGFWAPLDHAVVVGPMQRNCQKCGNLADVLWDRYYTNGYVGMQQLCRRCFNRREKKKGKLIARC